METSIKEFIQNIDTAIKEWIKGTDFECEYVEIKCYISGDEVIFKLNNKNLQNREN